MKVKWVVVMDRSGDESHSKSGCVHTVVETGDMLIKKYEEQFIKPEIEIVECGHGLALCAYLKDKGIPFILREVVLTRIGGADVYKGTV